MDAGEAGKGSDLERIEKPFFKQLERPQLGKALFLTGKLDLTRYPKLVLKRPVPPRSPSMNRRTST